MVILIMERAPASLRGELSRWMIEPRAGVFVGKVSAMVRERLWEKACRGAKGAGALLIYSSQTEQGFSVRSHGDTSRSLVNIEGLNLVHVPQKTRKTAAPAASADPFEETRGPNDT